MTRATATARGAAVDLHLGVVEGGLSLSELLDMGLLDGLAPSERARAQRLALTVLRQLSRADAVLKPHLRKWPPLWVQAILRLATVEMLVEGAAAHGVVSSAVDLVRAGGEKGESFAGLVNAVLRKVAETDPAAWAALPPPELPAWLRGRLMSAFGKASVQAMEAVHANGAPLDLTPKDGDAVALAAQLGGKALATGSVRLAQVGQITGLASYAAGGWWVQDAGAALAARALAVQPGERVLDLCAAPGGKTMQLAAAGAQVTALDLSAPRMERVAANLARVGLAAEMVVADALDWQAETGFDAVLLDAPCTATGTIRRHPELPLIRDGKGLRDLVSLQARLIDRAVALTRPGGRLVVCTCSLLPEEGEQMLASALGRHAGALTLDTQALALPGVEPDWHAKAGGLRLRPDHWAERGGIDGFFIAAFRRSD